MRSTQDQLAATVTGVLGATNTVCMRPDLFLPAQLYTACASPHPTPGTPFRHKNVRTQLKATI